MNGLRWIRWMVCVGIACIASENLAYAQTSINGRTAANREDVWSRLRPIGSPSAVDAFTPSPYPVRQVAMMQVTGDGAFVPPPSLQGNLPLNTQPPNPLPQNNFGAPTGPLPTNPAPLSPPLGFSLPSSSNPLPAQPRPPFVGPVAPQSNNQPSLKNLPFNNAVAPHQLSPQNPTFNNGGLRFQQPGTNFGSNNFGQPARSGANDYAVIAPPQLGNDYASMGNCRNISGPSTYRAAGIFGCNAPANFGTPIYGPTTYGPPATYVAPPAQIAPAIGLPPGAVVAPASYAGGSLPPVLPGNPGYRPLLSFGQEKNPVQVGQGLLGQPVAYVPGQFIRNALRYISF